jgi:ABC-type multidrug transport system fused ATPase/permease subunit
VRVRSLYARTWGTVLAAPSLGFAIVVGALMHASGHALLAAAGGVLARSLAGGAGPMDDRSIRVLQTVGGGDPMLGLAIGGLVAATAKLMGGVVAGWAEARVAGEVGAALRLEVLDGLHGATSLRAPRQRDHGEAHVAPLRGTADHVGTNIARLASLTTHVSEVERGVANGVFAEARAALQLVPLVALLAVLAPRLAGSAALALGGFAFVVLSARRALKRSYVRASRENDALLGAADEAVRHADLWATYGAEGRIRAHVAALGRTLVATAARLRARSALLSGTSEVLGALALVLTLALVGAGAIGGVDRGAIVPFAIAFFMAYKPLRELVEGRLARARGEEALAASDEPRTSLPEVAPSVARTREREAPGLPDWSLAELSVAGLVAQHGEHEPLTMRIAPGTIAAIVGPTGIGKTSLLRALLGLDEARAGSVRWGEHELSERGIGPTQRPFAWVPQDAPVLGDTLVANVVLGRADTDDGSSHDEIAARVLGDLGASGLAASVGSARLATERCVSGGERQWIAVARALATRLPVLLLDEPTSSLDPASQEKMLRALAGLRGKRTVVIVTHRTEPLAIADQVVRLGRAELPSDREDAQDGAGGDAHGLGAEQLSVEDVGAPCRSATSVVELAETELGAPRERVDVARAEERAAREHERELRAEP